jgi:hypothetical protein
MREKQGTTGAKTSARESFQRVFGTDPEFSVPEVLVSVLNDAVKHGELLGVTGKTPLRLCPTVSECEETLVRVNIGLDVRPGM